MFTNKETLFYYINSYWLLKLLSSENNNLDFLKIQIINNHKIKNKNSDFLTGFKLGTSILDNYKKNGVVSIPKNIKTIDKELYKYLNKYIYCWAVPLSYSYLLTENQQTFDKKLNLIGCEQNHRNYFNLFIDMILSHLKKMDSKKLPVGIMDMGCGNGAFLRQLKKILNNHGFHNFLYAGVDNDENALNLAKNSDDNKKIIYFNGDVALPDEIDKYLNNNNLPALQEWFQTRAFVDHNSKPNEFKNNDNNLSNNSNYYYLYSNTIIDSLAVKNIFNNHFKRWKPYIKKYGLAIIELHSTNHKVNQSPCIAYEIFHILSEQYILNFKDYSEILANNGYILKYSKNIPQNNPNISISIYI